MSVQHHIRERQAEHSYDSPDGPLSGIDDLAGAVFHAAPEVQVVAIGVDLDRPTYVEIVAAPKALSASQRLWLEENSFGNYDFSFPPGHIDVKQGIVYSAERYRGVKS